MIDLLIIGAGPYGLSAAAAARTSGLDFRIVGQSMGFWRENMPEGMLLRSAAGWHLDPEKVHTFHRFLELEGMTAPDCDPIPIDLFLRYAEWFQREKGIEPIAAKVMRLQRDGEGRFQATLDGGEVVSARHVLCAPGMGPFAVIPPEFESGAKEHPQTVSHTSTIGRLEGYAGTRCLVVGGRQSAFEYAVLLAEAGAASVDIVYRHATPSFEASNWDWIEPLMGAGGQDPGWYRSQPEAAREDIANRFWAEGRLKLEPWLLPRLERGGVRRHEKTRVVELGQTADGAWSVRLDNGNTTEADRVILATGFKADVTRLSYLDKESILDRLDTQIGFPALSPTFESSVRGLYFTGFLAARDFGPFFGFIRAAGLSARTIVPAIAPQ